jgi:pSer/pThr/pTyr-binding forkhead associated (FHA) protein
MKLPPSIIVELIHIHGPMKGSIQEFSDGYVSIGRHSSCSVRFQSDTTGVSRKHADIIREGNQFKLVDHSTNGTYLNGRKVTEAYLKDGDVLEFSEGGPKVSFITKVAELPQVKPATVAQAEDPEVVREEILPGKSVQAKQSQPIRREEAHSSTPADLYAPPDPPSSPQQPVSKSPEELPTGKVNASLIIQFGPSLRSYRELPITIGSNPSCDFVIMHPTILERHAQIIFARDQYWIKDLTGQGKIRVNNIPIQFQASLNVNDLIYLAPQGPAFCFLGEGRFAEAAEEPVESAPVKPGAGNNDLQKKKDTETVEAEGLWAKLKKIF